ncbi:MAG: flagellar biosynthetic protein FliR [Deltaproteobacteria bacterium]|nr:flagellar biosynthetic protein FliR [Deltaproteobacteria bacterium]
MSLGNLNFNDLLIFLLVLLRTGALMMSLPVFSSPAIPPLAWAGLVLSTSLLLTPVVPVDPARFPANLPSYALLGVGEIMIGGILGLSVNMIFTAVQIMGQLAGFQMGFAVANVIDPLNGGQISVLSQFCYIISLLVLLGVGAHHWFFKALADSFTLVPPGDFSMSEGLYMQVMRIAADMFSLSLRIGAPVIGAMLLTKVAMGILAKTVPQMNILIVGFPLFIGVGLIFLSLTLTVMVPILAKTFDQLGPVLAGLLKAM